MPQNSLKATKIFQALAADTPQRAIEPLSRPTPAPAADDTIIVTAHIHERSDPFESINTGSFAAAQAIDGAAVKPLALAYKRGLPGPVRDGLHNFLGNLHQPDVALNYLLQGKPGKAAETVGRFVINTTIGVIGIVDVAKRKPFRLPDRPNGFADTLGFYGVKPGPFLFLPLIGPTTVRDVFGLVLDRALLPIAVGAPFTRPAYNIPTGIIKALDHRVRYEDRFDLEAEIDKSLRKDAKLLPR